MKTVVLASCTLDEQAMFALRDGVYTAVDRSELLDLDVATVVEAIDWS